MSKSLKNISVVATATVVSRVLGLVREIFITAVFGTSALNSAFVSAFTLPNLFRRLLGEGALTAAFVPTLAHELEHRQRAAAFAWAPRSRRAGGRRSACLRKAGRSWRFSGKTSSRRARISRRASLARSPPSLSSARRC